MELTRENLDRLTDEVRSAGGPGETTKTFNRTIIDAYRASGGKLSGDLAGARFLLLTVTGARSGRERTVPLAYVRTEGRILVIASKGGAETDPLWYRDLVANPTVTVELGDEVYQARAVVLEGDDRDRCFSMVTTKIPVFADYQQRTSRRIPVVELRRLDETAN